MESEKGNDEALSELVKINEAVFLSDFFKETHKCISETPLKYSGASSSRLIFLFIVREIKRSNYLISEL